MSGKASLLLAVFAVIAGTAVFGAFNTLTSSGQTASILDADPNLSAVSRDVDTDKDGLFDAQESTWRTSVTNPDTDGDGFLDGEEVASGHDPRVKGPNDAFIKPINLTQKTASLIAGGILSGDLQKGNINYEASLNRLSESLTEAFQNNTTITEDSLTLVADSTKTHASYIKAIAWALKNTLAIAVDEGIEFLHSLNDVPLSDLSILTSNASRYAAYQARMNELSRQSASFAVRLASIPVPTSIQSHHANLVQLLRVLERQYQIASTLKEDPIQGALAVHALVKIHTREIPETILVFSDALSSLSTQ